jgi:heme d1 biosynthesis radical SAM protein NirJ
MFRLSQFMHEIASPQPLGPDRQPPGPVVIWNLIRRCNLKCKHCYSISGDVNFPGELTTAEVFKVMDDLKAFRVPVLILSGGEPMLRSDIFEISKQAKQLGFYVGLSTNGTLITKDNVGSIADVGYDYVGISIDGLRETHDRFRQRDGGFDEAMAGIELCRANGIKVGMRFTATMDNAHELPALLDIADELGVEKFYLSHLVYAGRGNKNRGDDARRQLTRNIMDMMFQRAWQDAREGGTREFVTGNNDADGVYLLFWVRRHFPELESHIRSKLAQWGGNSSGVNIANIDNLGNVHPDTFWWHYNLGNVKERAFGDIWKDTSDPIMVGLKQKPRKVGGRCGQCAYFDVCGGNTRVRAFQITGDPWAEDPACYLDDAEIGVSGQQSRIEVTPFRGARHAMAATAR